MTEPTPVNAVTQPMPATVPQHPGSGSFLQRELNGATFLTLEHVGHMAAVVVVAVLLAVGLTTAFTLWTNSASSLSGFGVSSLIGAPGAKYIGAVMAISVVAGLLVLLPLMAVLGRRTRAEWAKRPEYAGRVAYKVPIYIALGALIALKLYAVTQMLTVVLTSLAMIGVSGAGIGEMYLGQFLPALIAAVVFGGAAWYLFTLAKGRDNGRTFSMAMMVVGGLLALALFITSAVALHSSSSPSTSPAIDDIFKKDSSSKSLNDLFNY